ncbi:hypothetical protein N0V86_009274 [Didymella sp. IMI 355093]|nr:hypothetical protein N0V86_009274 [Didymella sp. IMI 355093]
MAASTYDIVVFGEPSVGKTCFIDQFCYGKSFVTYSPDDGISMHEIVVDGRSVKLTLMDLSTSFLKPENAVQHPEWAEKMLSKADGVVLLFDVTSTESFEYITKQAYNFLWGCRESKKGIDDAAGGDERQSFGCVLAGNKLDLVTAKQEARAVSQALAEEWARSQGFRSTELNSLVRNGPEQALKLLVKNVWKLERLNLLVAKEEEQPGESTGENESNTSIRNKIKAVLRSSVV